MKPRFPSPTWKPCKPADRCRVTQRGTALADAISPAVPALAAWLARVAVPAASATAPATAAAATFDFLTIMYLRTLATATCTRAVHAAPRLRSHLTVER